MTSNPAGHGFRASGVLQSFTDAGFTAPANAATYWVGEAMQKLDYLDAGPKPETTGTATKTLAAGTAHLAQLLAANPYPAA